MDEKWIQKRLKKIMLFFILTSLVLVISGWITSIFLNATFKKEISEQIKTEVDRYKTNINRKIESNLQTLYTWASFMEFSENMDKDQFATGLYESNNHNSFIQMGYFEKQKFGVMVTLNSSIAQNVQAEETNPELYGVIEKAWNGESAISEVYYDDNLEEDFIAYAVPVRKDGAIIGTLVACESTSNFFDVMKIKSGFSEKGSSVGIIDVQGGFVVNMGAADTGNSTDSIYSSEMFSGEQKKELKRAIKNKESLFLDIVYEGEEYRSYVEPVEVHDWYLVFLTTEEAVNGPTHQNMVITRISYMCILILSCISVLYGYSLMKKHNKELLRFAYYDRLTGAYNMVNFLQSLERILQETVEFSVVAVNIRKFKFINEIFGDQVANQLLCQVKEVIDREIHEGEFFCRETADKFYILIRTSKKEEVKKRLEKITEDIRKIFLDQYREYRIMLYVGVVSRADIDNQDIKREELMTHVMFALGQARRKGQDDIVFYNEKMYKKEQLRNYIESHMNQALKNGEFRLFLQPKMNLKRKTIGGAEALVRWVTSEQKMIFPDQFIPLFEQNGFCIELDLYMMEQVCRQIREWIDQGKEPVPVSVNQSKLLFYEEGYVKRLCEIIKKYEIPAQMITLEILESLALEDAEGLNNRIGELKEKGFNISIDDFGSGYSSLNILSSLDIDELKLDRVFLMKKAGHKEWKQQVVMEQIIEMAKKMDITTVAEGVETPEDETLILNAGCDYGQGYYYSRPVCATEFTEKYIDSKK